MSAQNPTEVGMQNICSKEGSCTPLFKVKLYKISVLKHTSKAKELSQNISVVPLPLQTAAYTTFAE